MPPIPVIAVVSTAAILIFSTYYFSAKNRIKRKLKNAVYKPLAQFNNRETAKIQGTIVAIDTPLKAPLSNRQCATYSIIVEEKKQGHKNSYWKTIIEEDIAIKYLIQDGDKFAIINARNIKSHILYDKTYSSGFLNDASSKLEGYLNKKGHKSEGFLNMNKGLRYKEGVLEIGEKVTAFGKGIWKKGSEFDLPESYNDVLELTPPVKDAVYLSDDPITISSPEQPKKSNTIIT